MHYIKITSKLHGDYRVKFDKVDQRLVKRYNWYPVKDGNKIYAVTWIPGIPHAVRMHRLIMGIVNPKIQIDHKDGDGLNNTRQNIRIATTQQNSWNKGKKCSNNSGFKGVSFKKTHKKYDVRIKANGKHLWGGHFDNAIDAAKRYNQLAMKYFGKFAFLNQV